MHLVFYTMLSDLITKCQNFLNSAPYSKAIQRLLEGPVLKVKMVNMDQEIKTSTTEYAAELDQPVLKQNITNHTTLYVVSTYDNLLNIY